MKASWKLINNPWNSISIRRQILTILISLMCEKQIFIIAGHKTVNLCHSASFVLFIQHACLFLPSKKVLRKIKILNDFFGDCWRKIKRIIPNNSCRFSKININSNFSNDDWLPMWCDANEKSRITGNKPLICIHGEWCDMTITIKHIVKLWQKTAL